MSINRHVVVTGGAGFIGAHLCRALLDRGDRVTAIDNLCTGRYENIRPIVDRPGFAFREADVTAETAYAELVEVTHVVHLACPASPRANTAMPIETILAASVGTVNALDLAARHEARIVVASSSEVYGDPLVHPQREDYRGNTDLVGRYAPYTEGKRVTEAAASAYRRSGTNAGVVRPFNVYGPHMWPDDGRVVSSFCAAALRDEALRVHGGGQTRSFLYIADFVDAMTEMLDVDEFGPINVGSEHEVTIAELAGLVVEVARCGRLEIVPVRAAEVSVRRPDTTRAQALLGGWRPSTPLREGLENTLAWMVGVLAQSGERVVSP